MILWVNNMCRAHLWCLVSALQGIGWTHSSLCSQLAHQQGTGWFYLSSCICLTVDWGCWLRCICSLLHLWDGSARFPCVAVTEQQEGERRRCKASWGVDSKVVWCPFCHIFYKGKANGKVSPESVGETIICTSWWSEQQSPTAQEHAHGRNDSLGPQWLLARRYASQMPVEYTEWIAGWRDR